MCFSVHRVPKLLVLKTLANRMFKKVAKLANHKFERKRMSLLQKKRSGSVAKVKK